MFQRPSSFALAIVALLAAPPAEAAEILVTTTSDDIADGDSRCTLREAIASANADAPLFDCTAGDGPDTIVLGSTEDHVISLAGANEDGNLTGDFDITDDLTIRPAEGSLVTIDGGGLDRIFNVHGGADLTLENIDVRGGSVIGWGGGILTVDSGSFLTLRSSVVANNDATLFGGGISSEGPVSIIESFILDNQAAFGAGVYASSEQPLTLIRSEVSENRASADGGGVNAARVQVFESSISGNGSDRDGGGFYLRSEGVSILSVLVNSTVAYNDAFRDGGGLFIDHTGTVGLFSSTIAFNAADSDADQVGDGGGFFVASGSVEPSHVLLGANADLSTTGNQAPDCFGAIASAGHNLFSAVDFADCVITGATANDLNGSLGTPLDPQLDPCLEPVDDSLTPGLRPLASSPVIDAGDEAGCEGFGGATLVVDQAGNWRVWDGPDPDQDAVCDIGAIEFGAPPISQIFADGFESGDSSAWGSIAGGLAAAPAGLGAGLPDLRWQRRAESPPGRGGCR